MIVFIHGAGGSGPDAWPTIDRDDAVFMDFSSLGTVAEQANALVAAIDGPAVVVAHSHGAIPTVLALSQTRERVRSLVLIEPALYDIARGDLAIERHIATMERARDVRETSGLEGYWRIVRPLMFGGAFDEARWPGERETASRFADVLAPWGFDIDAATLAGTRTVVVTGGWNDEYEAIARALVSTGAEHRVLEGFRHRPQDHPMFAEVLAELAGPAG